MNFQTFSFRVQAISEDKQRKSEALVILTVNDVNDHAPVFDSDVSTILVKV